MSRKDPVFRREFADDHLELLSIKELEQLTFDAHDERRRFFFLNADAFADCNTFCKRLEPIILRKRSVPYIAEVGALKNGELLEGVYEAAVPDDYDGCFTTEGEVKYTIYRAELEKRLEKWLSEDKDSDS